MQPCLKQCLFALSLALAALSGPACDTAPRTRARPQPSVLEEPRRVELPAVQPVVTRARDDSAERAGSMFKSAGSPKPTGAIDPMFLNSVGTIGHGAGAGAVPEKETDGKAGKFDKPGGPEIKDKLEAVMMDE